MQVSQLHFFSIGRVSSIKDRTSHIILVKPEEDMFSVQEEVLSQPFTDEINYQTLNGEENQKQVLDNSIPARWLKMNTNRWTPPDVRRGDNVLIWRLGDSDKYYWTDFNSANVKRLETVFYVFSADPKNPIKDDLSNAYFFAVSSHDKHVTLTTSQANGEPFGYTIQLNTAEGRFVVEDTAENQIFLDSAETVIGMINAKKTSLLLDKKNILGFAPDSMEFKATNTIAFKCKDFSIDASNSITETTKTYSVNCTTYTCKGEAIKLIANSVISDAPTTTCTGALVAASLSVGGGARAARGGFAAKITGSVEVLGSMNVSGTIKCGTIQADNGNIANFSHGGPPCC